MNFILTVLKGMVIGLANLIPGVSGGTMALILGIYERMITAIHSISLKTVSASFGLLTFSGESRSRFLEEMKRIDFIFLCQVFGGAAVAALLFARLMMLLLTGFHDPTYGFFFGLVLPSVYVPFREIKKHSAPVYFSMLLAALLVIGSDSIISDDELIEKEQTKYELAQAEQSAALEEKSQGSSFSPVTALLLGASGAVAVSAMILPGVSGSFVLLLMGQYFVLLKAVSDFNIPYVLIFLVGVVAGLLLFTRLLYFLLNHFHNSTMGFLTGLVAGSLWVIWPFKSVIEIGKAGVDGYPETIYLSNVLPSAFGANEIVTLLAGAAGVAVVILMIHLEKGTAERKENAGA